MKLSELQRAGTIGQEAARERVQELDKFTRMALRATMLAAYDVTQEAYRALCAAILPQLLHPPTIFLSLAEGGLVNRFPGVAIGLLRAVLAAAKVHTHTHIQTHGHARCRLT